MLRRLQGHLALWRRGDAARHYTDALRQRWTRLRAGQPLGRLVFAVYRDVKATLRPDDHLTLRIYLDRLENEIPPTLERWLRPGMTVLDVGANVGLYASIFGRLVGPEGRVHAFEPVPRLARRMEENLALNGLANVEVHPLAVGAAAGAATLHLSRGGGDGWASLYPWEWSGSESIRVQVVALDEWLEARGRPRVDLLKVDVEGAEMDVLRGAERSLADGTIRAVIVEFNRETQQASGYGPGELRAALERHGFRWYALPWAPGAGRPVEWERLGPLCDLIAVRES